MSKSTVINMPGTARGTAVPQLGDIVGNPAFSNSGQQSEHVDMMVYFTDKVGMHLKIQDGQNISAGELFELVLEELDLEATDGEAQASVLTTAREVFSLWLVSDLLELQLKSTHVPFKLICYWEELLEKYTSAPEEARERDEPAIVFKRNVYYHRTHEKSITNGKILKLLYHEAKSNILNGHYPLTQDECDERAALQAVITHQELMEAREEEGAQSLELGASERFGSAAYFKSRLLQYLPAHLSKRNLIFHTASNPEKRLAQRFDVKQVEFQGVKSLNKLYLEYLKTCWKLPYYGAAYLRGQAEHPGSRGLLSAPVDDPVYVAINVDGVFIIDMDDVVPLLGLYFEELSWQLVESKDSTNENCLPCLFLQFREKKKTGETKLLQIFSKEAVLMDNLIESCVQLKSVTRLQPTTGDTTDSAGSEDFRGEIIKNFERLALITVDANGALISSNVRQPKNTNNR